MIPQNPSIGPLSRQRATLDMLFIGKRIEFIDMYSRFGEKHSRLAAEWRNMDRRLDRQSFLVNKDSRMALREIFFEHDSIPDQNAMLTALNSLIRV